jgi:hypothetical protein
MNEINKRALEAKRKADIVKFEKLKTYKQISSHYQEAKEMLKKAKAKKLGNYEDYFRSV